MLPRGVMVYVVECGHHDFTAKSVNVVFMCVVSLVMIHCRLCVTCKALDLANEASCRGMGLRKR